ncbi:MAG: M28 family peptidase [Planctomycetota bacterium]
MLRKIAGLFSLSLLGLLVGCLSNPTEPSSESASVASLASGESANSQLGARGWKPPAPLDSKRAMGYLEKLCKLGSRTTGTVGMEKQQRILEEHFQALGAQVQYQSFSHKHPLTGQAVEVKNLIVTFKPELKPRVMLCSHYDTRPYPDQDPKNPKGLFIGANDGGSSTALLMELGHAVAKMDLKVGVDFVFFDAEELVYNTNNGTTIGDYFVGSTYFAQQLVANGPQSTYRAGILMDMIGDKDLQLSWDEVSFKYAPELAKEVWGVAKELGLKEFSPRVLHSIRDDHLPLNEIALLPTIDIIDFDYPTVASRSRSYWHTMNDTPDKCSGDSITKVAAVVMTWLQRQKP